MIREGGLAADLDFDPGDTRAVDASQNLHDALGEFLLHFTLNEAVRREKQQALAVFDRLQGSNPGVELLWGQLAFELVQTLFPQRNHGP